MVMINTGPIIVPNPRQLMNSLRSIGYDFSQAVADLIDNSIDAGAKKIIIDVEFDGDHSRVRITDDGRGMSPDELQEAMRYGSNPKCENIQYMGKFGLGLKTASLSQCQCMSVASRNDPNQEFQAYCWDLNYIEKTDKWQLTIPDSPAKFKGTSDLPATGTIVLWERLDRMLNMAHPYGDTARKRLLNLCRDLEDHLAMVFHRFLSGKVPGKKVILILNNNIIEPWDPFVEHEKETQKLETKIIQLNHNGCTDDVILEPYILPHQKKFSSPDAFEKASGPKKWNRQQGFYIYRSDRLIQSGGWSRIRTNDEHTKLARVALSFSPILDDAFNINIAKMRVQMPPELVDKIGKMLVPYIKQAKLTYDRNEHHAPVVVNPPAPIPPQPIPPRPPEPPRPQSQKLWKLDELERELEVISCQREKEVIREVFNRFRNKNQH